MNKVEKAILKTLAFFDIFGRPLTLEELWHYLYEVKASKLQVLINLKKLEKKKIVKEKQPYFALYASKNIFNNFSKTQDICRERWKKVQRTAKILKLVPFVKNISVINSLAFTASNLDSDIDILLVAAKNRLWTARALMILVLEILGQNKNKWYKANKFCLGFGFDEKNLDLTKMHLDPPIGKDIYLKYWLATLKPVFDRKIYPEFIKENTWIYKEFPNWTQPEVNSSYGKKTFLEKILDSGFGDKLERFLALIQIKRIWSDPENVRKGSSVIAELGIMKLHAYYAHDKLRQYQEAWENLTKNI